MFLIHCSLANNYSTVKLTRYCTIFHKASFPHSISHLPFSVSLRPLDDWLLQWFYDLFSIFAKSSDGSLWTNLGLREVRRVPTRSDHTVVAATRNQMFLRIIKGWRKLWSLNRNQNLKWIPPDPRRVWVFSFMFDSIFPVNALVMRVFCIALQNRKYVPFDLFPLIAELII